MANFNIGMRVVDYSIQPVLTEGTCVGSVMSGTCTRNRRYLEGKMAGYVKDNPECNSEIVFLGNVKLRPYTKIETDPKFSPPATDELVIDVLASPAFFKVDFEDIELFLEITSPPGVQFVETSTRRNFRWGIPDGASWVEKPFGRPTTKLRARDPKNALLSGVGNGLSYEIGVQGLQSGSVLNIHAHATANKVTAATSSCPLQVENLGVGDRIDGYMK